MAFLSQLTIPVADAVTGEVSQQTFDIRNANVTINQLTLSAGSTSVTFTGIITGSGSMVQVGFSKEGLDYNSVTASNKTAVGTRTSADYTVTVDAQSEAVTVYLIITEV